MKNRAFADLAVKAAFASFSPALRPSLLRLRALIFQVADEAFGAAGLIETLKWQQPAYLPAKARTGTTIRIDAAKGDPHAYTAFFHCQTTLLGTFRDLYGNEFVFQGNRALIFSRRDALPTKALKHCIALALTYHAKRPA